MRLRLLGPTALDKYYPPNCSDNERNAVKREPAEKYHKKSLLSIIADSAQVQVFIIDKTDMSYLPDRILKDIFY